MRQVEVNDRARFALDLLRPPERNTVLKAIEVLETEDEGEDRQRLLAGNGQSGDVYAMRVPPDIRLIYRVSGAEPSSVEILDIFRKSVVERYA